MLTRAINAGGHWAVILGGIGATAGLAATGHLTSTAAGMIGTLAGAGGLAGLMAKAASGTATKTTP